MAIACPDCGTVQTLPRLPDGRVAECVACALRLERTTGRSLDAALAAAVSALLLLVPANTLVLMSVRLAGATRHCVVATGVGLLWHRSWPLIATQIALFAVILPFVRLGLLVAVLATLRLGRRPRWLGPAFRWAETLDPWAMPDVFLMGCLVGYSRLVALLPTTVGPGGWCLAGAALMALVADSALERRTVWRLVAPEPPPPAGPCLSCTACDLVLPVERAGGRCPRCAARLAVRKPRAEARTAALLAAAALLYGPANVYPMTSTLRAGVVQDHTILHGIGELAGAHLWPLAAVVFTASVAIPVAKLLGLSWMVLSVRRRSRAALGTRTRLYRLVDRIGRWSNVDVFTIAVFVPLMRFDGLVAADAGRGADAFLLVVVLTMLASNAFDPRLMWDAAKERP